MKNKSYEPTNPIHAGEHGPDFIVSELLSELKADGVRKGAQVEKLQKALLTVVIVAFAVALLITGSFLLYLNQYDFTSTQTIEHSAEGIYAIVDSEGNTIAWDITPEEMQAMLEVVVNGESTVGQNLDPKED